MRLSRRHVLGAAAALAAGYAPNASAVGTARTLCITPDGSGDGSSWESAASLASMPQLMPRLQPGGEVLIASDRGEYILATQLEIFSGGSPGAPIIIRGVDSRSSTPMPAILRGNRSATEVGREAFRLLVGANYLRFSHFDFRDIGDGCFRVAGSISGLTIEDCGFDNVYRFLENTVTGSAQTANLREFSVSRCTGRRVARSFSRIRYQSSDGVFALCSAHGQANIGGDIPVGCALEDGASRITYRRCVMEGFQQLHAGHYWNGDGFSDEMVNANIRYENCEARGSTDGGFDCKSTDVVLENCLAEDNKRNFRIWGGRATLTGCTSRAPNFRGHGEESADACHIWIGGAEPALIQLNDFTVVDNDATDILDLENERATVDARGVRIQSPRTNWGDDLVQHTSGDVTTITHATRR